MAMPELPEVEVTRMGIAPHLQDRRIVGVLVRDGRLRRPVNEDLAELLAGQRIQALERRGKYLLLHLDQGQLLLHLGMSGSLRVLPRHTPLRTHDHVDIYLDHDQVLRFHDPRRFGLVLWGSNWFADPLLAKLGPEPFDSCFDGAYLFRRSRGRQQPVKSFLMDNQTVVGVGNIYANESLFRSGIDPRRAAGRISLARYEHLARTVVTVLQEAIAQGGTTLRDFTHPDGESGYFRLSLLAYGRAGQSCQYCGTCLREVRLAGRSTVYCPHCQH